MPVPPRASRTGAASRARTGCRPTWGRIPETRRRPTEKAGRFDRRSLSGESDSECAGGVSAKPAGDEVAELASSEAISWDGGACLRLFWRPISLPVRRVDEGVSRPRLSYAGPANSAAKSIMEHGFE
jgi:hypothetical protein